MSNETFVQERAYIYVNKPGDEELLLNGGVEECEEEEEDRGVIIIDILGE